MKRRAVRGSEGLTLDAGGLIAIERGDRSITILLREALDLGARLSVPSGVLAQVFRDPGKQVRLARFLATSDYEPVSLDDIAARAIGRLLAARAGSDVVDASVVVCARSRRQAVLTSDPDDLRALDPELVVLEV